MLFMIEFFDCTEQSCKFHVRTWAETKNLTYYSCEIFNTTLSVDPKEVTTNTKSHNNSNGEVYLFNYVEGNQLEFIPNSIFTTFPNLQVFLISKNASLDNLKPDYLLNAKKLTALEISGNPITELNGYIFEEAPRLKIINLHDNLIESIHWLTFKGLCNLLVVNLQGNRISRLVPTTFSNLLSIEIVKMEKNLCLNETFYISNYNFTEIENVIDSVCEQNEEEVWGELSIVVLIVVLFMILSFVVVKGSMWWSMKIESAIFQGMKYKGDVKKNNEEEETDAL